MLSSRIRKDPLGDAPACSSAHAQSSYRRRTESRGLTPPVGKQTRHRCKNPAVIVLLGPPGSGKTTQSYRIAAATGATPVSIGAILRERSHGDEGTIARGRFVTDDVAIEALRTHISGIRGELILDGFPRTSDQARRLASIDPRLKSCAIFVLTVSEFEVRERLERRMVLEGRADDTVPAIAARLALFDAHLSSVIETCLASGHSTMQIDGSAAPPAVTASILARLP